MFKGELVICTSNLGFEDQLTVGEIFQITSVNFDYTHYKCEVYRLRHSRSLFPCHFFRRVVDNPRKWEVGEIGYLPLKSSLLRGSLMGTNYDRGTPCTIKAIEGTNIVVEIQGATYKIFSGVLYRFEENRTMHVNRLVKQLEREVNSNGK